jgi:hypothetical protein
MGPQGPTILTEEGQPGSIDGIDGQFYLDSAGQTLYGPKNESALGPPLSMIDTLSPTAHDGAGAYTLGTQFVVNVKGSITAVRYWRNASSIRTSRKCSIWAGTTLVGTATSSSESGTGWHEVALTTPVDVVPGPYTVGYEVDNYSYAGGSPVSAVPELTWTQLCYGPHDSYPSTVGGGNYFADVVFREAGDIWPVALQGVIVLTQAEYDALSPPTPGAVYVVT